MKTCLFRDDANLWHYVKDSAYTTTSPLAHPDTKYQVTTRCGIRTLSTYHNFTDKLLEVLCIGCIGSKETK